MVIVGTSRSVSRRMSSATFPGVWCGSPNIMSTLNGRPVARSFSIAFSDISASWPRPAKALTSLWSDCTPTLKRLKPIAQASASSSCWKLSGLPSSEISQSSVSV